MVRDLFDDSGDGTAILRLHVQPGAGRPSVIGRHGDAVAVRVASPPDKGRANEACTALLADLAGVDASTIELASGGASRSKRFRLTGLDIDDFVGRLELALDQASGNAVGRGSVPKFPGSR